MRLLLMGALLLGLAAGCDGAPDQADTQKPGAGQGTASAQPAAPGEIDRSLAGQPAPDAGFTTREGKELTLAAFRGQPVLVNLWATWCAPCVAEMPALDRLASDYDGQLAVVTVSQDIEGWKAVDPFFERSGLDALTPYLDQKNALALAVGARGLPVSILYDAEGRELWRVNGPLEWGDAAVRDELFTES